MSSDNVKTIETLLVSLYDRMSAVFRRYLYGNMLTGFMYMYSSFGKVCFSCLLQTRVFFSSSSGWVSLDA